MGYRARLGKVTKEERERFNGLTYEQAVRLVGEDNSLAYPNFHTQLFELGKYFDTPEHLEEFYNFDLYAMQENEFKIISKEGLRAIIEMYHDNIAMMYTEAAETKEKACQHIEEKIRTWIKYSYAKFGYLPYYLDEPERDSDGAIAKSWTYEYAIFNLVHIYRTFDWEKDYLIYSAW